MGGCRMNQGIKKTFIAGVFWGVLEKFSVLFVGFFITILLARKLTPADYGLVNMLYIFTLLANVILDAGFGQALIQKKTVTDQDTSTVFYFNVVFSLFLYGLLYALAPYIAQFYRQPLLTDIARVSFLMIPVNSLCIIQHVLLTKNLKVKELTIVSVSASFVSGVVGVFLAYTGHGVWALVFQGLTLQVVRAMILWTVGGWTPRWVFQLESIRSIWNFSLNILGVGFLSAIFQNIYTVIIGRFYNVNEVGFYNQAQRLESVASTAITSSIQRVSFPAFAALQDNKERLREAFKKVMDLTMYVHLPVMIGVIAVGHDLFLLLLGEKWLPSVPYFELLCIASAMYPLHMINVSVLKGVGLGKLYFRLEAVKRGLIVAFIFLTVRYSIYILLVGYVIATVSSTFLNMYCCGKAVEYKLIDQLKDLLSTLGCNLLMYCSIQLFHLCAFSPMYRLSLDIIGGILIYVLASYLLRVKPFFHLLNIILKRC